MLFSSKALSFVVTASVASLIVAQEEACTPKEYIAALHEGVDCTAFGDGLAAAGGAYVGDDGACQKIVEEEDAALAYISVCPANTEGLAALAMLVEDDDDISIADDDDEPIDDDEFMDDEDTGAEDGDPFEDEGLGDLDEEDDLDLEEETGRKLGGRKLQGRELFKIRGNMHEPHRARSFGHQWNLDAINAKEAWECNEKNLGNPDVHVSVIDTGIDWTHKELVGKVNRTKSMSFVYEPRCGPRSSRCRSHRDYHSHGTAVASIVSSNAFNVAGVTSKTSLISMKACNRFGKCRLYSLLWALKKSIKVGADVAVLRWTNKFAYNDGYVAKIFNYVLKVAAHKGMTVVVGAGDFKYDLDNYAPHYSNLFCELDNVICVSATGPLTKWDHKVFHVDFPAYYSNYGVEAIDVAAPGGNHGRGTGILAACSRSRHSFFPNCRHTRIGRSRRRATYAEVRGTAYAAAHVAGQAALLVDEFGRMPKFIKKKILDTADQVADPYDPYFGGNGRINLYEGLCPACCCDMKNYEKTWWSGDMFPVNDCTEYVTCNAANYGMQTTPLPCPAGLLFKRAKWGDKWGGFCDWPVNVDCTDVETQGEPCMPCPGQD